MLQAFFITVNFINMHLNINIKVGDRETGSRDGFFIKNIGKLLTRLEYKTLDEVYYGGGLVRASYLNWMNKK